MSISTLRTKDHYKAVARELADAGLKWREEVGGKHARLIISVNGREETEILSLSPSDFRAPMKARSHIRRRIKQWKAEGVASLATETPPAQFPTLEKRTMDDTTSSTDNSISRLQPRPNTISGLPVETVNARDLHDFLAVKSQFRDWIKNRIEDFGFIEGNDFATAIEIYRGGERKDYHLSVDMAKELAMVERNPKGRAARQYFIECERRAKEASSPLQQVQVALNDPAQLRALLLDNVEKVLVLEAELEEAKPLAAAYDHLTRADGTMCITDAAKTLQMRPKDLFSFLHSRKWIYRRPGNGHWVGYQDKLQQGLLDHRVNEVTASDGFSKITEQVRLTAKGLGHIAKMVVPA